jgi:cyclase
MKRIAALLAAAMSSCAFAADYPFTYQRVQVAEGIYAFVEPFGFAIVSSNVVAIVGDDAVAVIDTGHHPRLTRAIAAEIRALTPKPVRYVVNTHWHNDHVSGNSVLGEAFPGATFVAHAFTAAVMDKDVRAFQGPNCKPFLRTQSQPLRDGIASGKGADGAPIAEARLARMRRVVAEVDVGIEECDEFRYRGTDLTFEDRVTLRLGKRDVELLHLGRANTAGDVIAWIPDAKVLASGDIVVHPFPFATQSYIGEWVAVLRRIDAMPFETLVPGHGPVMRDRKYLRQVAEVMDSVMAQARAAYRPGMTAEELKKRIDLKAARAEFSGDNAMIGANFDYNVGDLAVARAWQELAGKFEPEGFKDP